MITNTGKSIINKYLLGQAPAYASYIAVGSGPKPLASTDPYGDYSNKTNLDFEMFRVPISSRGIVSENGVEKIVLTAELPTEERYEISEIAIYSAGSNSVAGNLDSKNILSFSSTENWQYHTQLNVSSIFTATSSLDTPANNNIINVVDPESTSTDPLPVFQTNNDNPIFFKQNRSERYERCRFLNNVILINGNTSNLQSSLTGLNIQSSTSHIHLSGFSVDFSRNSPLDELRMAFSVINKDGASTNSPDRVRMSIIFSETEQSTEFARLDIDVENGTGAGQFDLDNNRYCVVSKKLEDLYATTNFSWNLVRVVRIYVSTLNDISGTLTPTEDYFVGLDALRLENVSSKNPLYGMVGYTVIKNTSEETIIKYPNTSNYIEFRFTVGT